MKITYLKSTAFLFFKLSTYRYDLGLSNELLIIIIAQGDAELWPFKIGGLKKFHAQAELDIFLLSIGESKFSRNYSANSALTLMNSCNMFVQILFVSKIILT